MKLPPGAGVTVNATLAGPHSSPAPDSAPTGGRSRRRLHSTTRAALWLSFAAFLVHLVPLFLPRKVPAVELRLASLLTDPHERLRILEPLLTNGQATAAHLRAAGELTLLGSTAMARTFLEEAERRDPLAVENLLLRARICRAERDDACVKDALARAYTLAPTDPRPDLLEAELARESGDASRALQAFARAFGKSSDDLLLAKDYARALSAAGKLEDAKAILQRFSSELSPAELEIEQGLLALEAGLLPDARRAFDAAALLERSSGLPRYYLGVTLAREGDWAKALGALREADWLDRRDYRALALICALQRENGLIEEAVQTRVELEARFDAQRAEYEIACPP